MALLGDTLGYDLLCWLSPPELYHAKEERAYTSDRSKLDVCLGSDWLQDIAGKVVIDFGCGTGDQAIELAKRGARKVIGVDIRESVLEIARASAEAAGVADRCVFTKKTEERADIVISLDSFEHFEEPSQILSVMARLLKPNGSILVSFGPPWYHPLGGHVFSSFPWAHLIFSEKNLLRWRSHFNFDNATKFSDVDGGLNRMTIRRFCRLINQSPFRFEYFEAKPIHWVRWLANPLTREFFTSIVRCKLVFKQSFEVQKNSRISKPIRRGVKSLLSSPIVNLAFSPYAGLGTVLMYHRIVPDKRSNGGFYPNIALCVHKDSFEEQVAYLAKHYRCLDLDTGVKLLRAGQLPRNSVIITFDDGYKDNLELALPILERYQVPATLYITTGLIDHQADLWWMENGYLLGKLKELNFTFRETNFYWKLETVEEKEIAFNQLNLLFKSLNREDQGELLSLLRRCGGNDFSYEREMLSWDEVRYLDRHPLITIGAHTKNHSVLSRATDAELLDELTVSKQILESKLGHPVTHFSYPYGEIAQASKREFQAVAHAGYASACTTRPGHLQREHAQHLLALPRMSVIYHDNLQNFLWKLNGLESLVCYRGRRYVTDYQ